MNRGNKSYGRLKAWVHEDAQTSLEALGQPVVDQEVDSYIRAWGDAIASNLGNQTISGTKDVNGNTVGIEFLASITIDANAGNTTRGTVIGSGGGGESMSDFSLDSDLISEFDHGSTKVGTGVVGSLTHTTDITRTFTNTSGSKQTVAEAGIRILADDANQNSTTFLIIRDALSTTFDVQDSDNTTIEYTLTFQV